MSYQSVTKYGVASESPLKKKKKDKEGRRQEKKEEADNSSLNHPRAGN